MVYVEREVVRHVRAAPVAFRARSWRRAGGGVVLGGLSLALCLLAAVPLAYITVRAFEAPPSVWANLWQGQIPRLLGNTVRLVAAT
jgi:ABC-type Fe3+ transport system permease subunit